MSEPALPPGWSVARLRDVTVPGGTRNPRSEDKGEFLYVDIDALDNAQQKIVAPKRIPNSEAPSRARMRIHKGDVLFSLVRPYLKNIAVIPHELDGQIASTAYCVLRPAEDIVSSFVFYCLMQDSFIQSVRTYGTSPPSARDEEFLDLEVPVAPLHEQRRIVEKIEELFSKLDAGVAALRRARANLKRYRAAVLKAAVEGSLTEEWRAEHPDVEQAAALLESILRERRRKWEEGQLAKYAKKRQAPPVSWQSRYQEPAGADTSELSQPPQGWCWATLGQLSPADRPCAYGVLQPGDEVPSGVPLVRVNDVADGKIALDRLKRISPLISARYERTTLRGGEVLLTIVGTIGRTAVAPSGLAGANTARAVAVIPIAPPVEPRYVEITLRDSRMRARLTRTAHEVARKTLNLEDVRLTPVPLCTLAEGQEIVSEVERRMSLVDEAERLVVTGLRRAARLRQSVLRCAFEGKLVPPDPRDEPASALLQRIVAVRATAGRQPDTAGTRRGRQRMRAYRGMQDA